MTTLTTPELPPEEYYSEHCAARFPYLLAYASAHWERSWLQPGHCVLSAGSWSARTTGELRSRLTRPTASTVPTFHAARKLAGGQHLELLTDSLRQRQGVPTGQLSEGDLGEWLSCSIRQWGHWRRTRRVPRRQGSWPHGRRCSTLGRLLGRIQGLRSSVARTKDPDLATDEASRASLLRPAIA